MNPTERSVINLRACDDPADIIYTNTDKTYGIFAFVGRYMKIGGFCYELEEIDCGNHDYQAVKTIYSGSSLVPVVYTDCDCDLISPYLTITDDTNPTPTPTPATPTPTPTLTPTPTRTLTPTPTPSSVCGSCSYGYVDNNALYPQLFTYRDCNTLEIIEVSLLDQQSSDEFCYCDGSVALNPDMELFDIGACPTPTPTPTPSFTPTPSPLPSLCYEYEITNESSEGQLEYAYIPCGDCEVAPTTAILNPSQIGNVCACDGSVSILAGIGNIVKGLPCE